MDRPYSPGVQLLILLGVSMLMQFAAQFIFALLMLSSATGDPAQEITASTWTYLLAGFLFQLMVHFLGFFLFLRITGLQWRQLIALRRPDIRWMIALVPILVVSYFAMEGLSAFSHWLFEATENYSFIEAELVWQQELTTLLTHNDPALFAFSLLVIGLMPAIGEELIYRGLLFSRLYESTKNPHFAAVISGLIFGAIHGLPLQILPIAGMGVLFAYVYHYSRNLWYCILLHFLYNAIQIALFYFWPELVTA